MIEKETSNFQAQLIQTVDEFRAKLDNVYEQIIDQSEQLQFVNEVGQLLTSTLDRKQVLQNLMQQLVPKFRVERSSFWLADNINNLLHFQFSLKQNEVEDRISAFVEIGEGSIVGIVAQTCKPIIDNDIQSNPNFNNTVDKETGFVSRQTLAVPLLKDNKTVGVVQLLNRVDGSDFTPKDEALLANIAPWLVLALDNASLYQNSKDLFQRSEQAIKMARATTHSLKNHLGSSRIYVDQLRKEDISFAQRIETLDKIENNLKRSVNITSTLIRPYIREEKTLVAPKALILDALDLLESPSEIEINVVDLDHLPYVLIEANNAVDYIHELLTNAVKAIQNKKRIEGYNGQPYIEIRGRVVRGTAVELFFSNNGPAIPKSRWESIFEEYTSSAQSKSTQTQNFGLGLWGTRTFFQRQSGHVRVFASSEERTTFLVTLPGILDNKG